MQLNISENLKRLRKLRGITQEDLAEFIGVSFQAISKWERGDGYPDITSLPVLANYFGVSVDELIGMNEINGAQEKAKINEQVGQLVSAGKIREAVQCLREAVKCFPNDYALLADLACYLDRLGDTDEERRQNWAESIAISERILRFCTDSEIRSNVQCNICFALWRAGEEEQAMERARKLPNLYKTRELTLNGFLRGEERVTACQSTVQMLVWSFWMQIKLLTQTEHYTADEKIRLHQKAIDFYRFVYDAGDFHFSWCRIQESYEKIALLSLEKRDTDAAISALVQAAECAIALSGLSGEMPHTSLLVNALCYQKAGTFVSAEKNAAWHLKKDLAQDEDYAAIRDDSRIRALMAELEMHGG